MNPEGEEHDKESWHDDTGGINKNNNAEARLYAASKNRKKNSAPRYGTGSPGTPPPAPPLSSAQEYMNYQEIANPYIPQVSSPEAGPPQQPPFYHSGTFPNHERNPQPFHGSIPRIPAAAGAHRPKRLKVPAVLATQPQAGALGPQVPGVPLPQAAGGLGHNVPPPYFPPHPPGFQGAMPGAPGPGGHMPIMQQPGMGMQGINGIMGAPSLGRGMMMATYDNGWVVPSQSPINCPPGLEYLAEIDQLLIHQQIEILELLTGFETKNKYMIRNTLGQGVYFAAEESGCCNRQCLGPLRPFDLNFYDHYGNVVMHMYRPLACACCCCPCCLQSIEVSAPPGNVIGSIHQNWSVMFPRFSVKDATGSTIMKIHGPFLTYNCCCKDVDFQIKTANGKVDIGKITKQWSGFVQEMFTDTDNFSVSFPLDMDISAKALLLAAVFLIDFMYYETNDN